jgi:hypothetical protein
MKTFHITARDCDDAKEFTKWVRSDDKVVDEGNRLDAILRKQILAHNARYWSNQLVRSYVFSDMKPRLSDYIKKVDELTRDRNVHRFEECKKFEEVELLLDAIANMFKYILEQYIVPRGTTVRTSKIDGENVPYRVKLCNMALFGYSTVDYDFKKVQLHFSNEFLLHGTKLYCEYRVVKHMAEFERKLHQIRLEAEEETIRQRVANGDY